MRNIGNGEEEEEEEITSIYCLSSDASVRNNVWMPRSSVIGLEILLCNCFLREQRDLRLLRERENECHGGDKREREPRCVIILEIADCVIRAMNDSKQPTFGVNTVTSVLSPVYGF